MPVGVPYVEYQLPGNPEPEWINMYNALYRERMLFLCQEIEDTISNELIGLMLYLNADDPSRALFLYINSPGGSVTCGIGIYDIMRYLNSGITTICMGTAASMASFILTGGTYNRRIALPNSRIMIHQPEGGSDGQATEILSESSEVARIRRQVGLIYANRTQQSIERIAQDLDRDQFMSAYEAKEYGLIDFVARSQKEEYAPGYDLLGLNTDNFQIPAFLKKLALGPVASEVESGGAFASKAESKLTASLPILFPAVSENDPKVVVFGDDPSSLPSIAWQIDALRSPSDGNLSKDRIEGRIGGSSNDSLVLDEPVNPGEQVIAAKRFDLEGLLPSTRDSVTLPELESNFEVPLAFSSSQTGLGDLSDSGNVRDDGEDLFESTLVEKLNSLTAQSSNLVGVMAIPDDGLVLAVSDTLTDDDNGVPLSEVETLEMLSSVSSSSESEESELGEDQPTLLSSALTEMLETLEEPKESTLATTP